ncbi:hypothetical protein PENTCL1PPCAC_27148, partial [Pristionchus entomophagus]
KTVDKPGPPDARSVTPHFAMSSPQKTPRDSTENDELDRLRFRLRTLAVSTPEELFKELGMIRAEYDAKAAVVEEELAMLEEELPAIGERLKQRRSELKNIKTEVLTQRADYKLHVKKVHDFAAEHCPDVIDRLSSINEKMARIDQLKCKERAGELIDNCSVAIPINDAEGVLYTLEKAIKHVHKMREMCPDGAAAYSNRLTEVASNIESWANKRLKQVLESIMWPWSDAQDERAYKTEIEELTKINGALYLALVLIVEEEEDSEPAATATSRLVAAVFDRVATRFSFHFYGSRKTADPLHPEFFLRQLILWMRHSIVLYSMVIQPVLEKNKVSTTSSHDSFIRLCCEIGREKARSLLDSVEYNQDVTLFSTLIDELISFEEQRDDWELCPGEFSILEVLCEEVVRKRWLTVENIACSARVDDILSSETRWNHRFVETFSDVDPLLVCEAADSFVSLLLCLRLRAKPLPCPVTRKMFVDLQVLLIDDFRSRLVQVANHAASPWEIPFSQIMNAMWYMEKSIEEWGEAELISALEGEGERAEARGRLGESVKMYKKIWNEMAGDVVGSFRSQLRSFAQNYASQNWRGVSRLRSGEREISAAFCPLLLRVRTGLSETADKMCTPAVVIIFRRMLEVVAEILMEHVITLVHFNCEGADQMSFDVGVGLVSVVNSVLERTEATMRVEHEKAMVKVLSCLRLLSLSVPNAMLLQEELHASGDDEAEEKMMAMKIHLVDKDLALSLLNRRWDIKLEGGRGPVKFGL